MPGRGDLPAAQSLSSRPNVSVLRHRLPSRALFGAAAVARRPRLDRLLGGSLDVVWAPAVAPMALSGDIPFVLTVFDLSFELRPRDFTLYERLWHVLARPRALARRARLVMVPAEATRDELIGRWGLSAAAVRVVPGGVDPPARNQPSSHDVARFGLTPRGYLLAVGALEPRKAPLLLARAFERARRHGLSSDLVFVGEGRLAEQLHGPGIRRMGRVSDGGLDVLYAGALAVVTPSLLEGYGLPVREGLIRGTPAIVSDLAVYGPELSPGVLRVPPGDERALTDAMVRIGREEELRDRLARAAVATVAGQTWVAAARRTRSVLLEASAAEG